MASDVGKFERSLYQATDFNEFFSSSDAVALGAKLREMLEEVEVLSLDVFDTVLLRDGQSELKRFADIAERFCSSLTPTTHKGISTAACLAARITAAQVAYSHSPMVEGTLEGRLADIAQNMMIALRLPIELADKWIDTELTVEAEQLRLSPFIDALISDAVSGGKRVIFVSDMYLDALQIQRLLLACDCDMSRVEALVSSADTTKNKRSGTIFSHLQELLGFSSNEVLHLGDSFTSDVRQPIRAGWAARHLPVPHALLKERYDCHFRTCEAIFGSSAVSLPMQKPAV